MGNPKLSLKHPSAPMARLLALASLVSGFGQGHKIAALLQALEGQYGGVVLWKWAASGGVFPSAPCLGMSLGEGYGEIAAGAGLNGAQLDGPTLA